MIQAQAAGGHWPKVLALLQERGEGTRTEDVRW